jgi:hypothetical protein
MARTALVMLGLVAMISAHYTVDPKLCAKKIARSDCFMNGDHVDDDDWKVGTKFSPTSSGKHSGEHARDAQKVGGKSTDATCIQCLVKTPGIASWGCPISELKEWCAMAFRDASFQLKEEMLRDKTHVSTSKFEKQPQHKVELAALRKSLSKGIAAFAGLLAKFEKSEDPEFTKEEAKIMNDILKADSPGSKVKSYVAKSKNHEQTIPHAFKKYGNFIQHFGKFEKKYEEKVSLIEDENNPNLAKPKAVKNPAPAGLTPDAPQGNN